MINNFGYKTIVKQIESELSLTLFTLVETPQNAQDSTREAVYMLEDPKTKNNPTSAPWRLFITIKRSTNNTTSITYTLDIRLPKTTDIIDIIETLESPYLTFPSLTIHDATYNLHIEKTINSSQLKHHTQGITKIIPQIYKIQTNPGNYQNLMAEVIEYF